jgi:hypothetical protein
MDIDLSHGPSYGDTLTWNDKIKPAIDFQPCTHLDQDLEYRQVKILARCR